MLYSNLAKVELREAERGCEGGHLHVGEVTSIDETDESFRDPGSADRVAWPWVPVVRKNSIWVVQNSV